MYPIRDYPFSHRRRLICGVYSNCPQPCCWPSPPLPFSPPPPAQAQDEEQYVDLWVEISVLSVNRNFEVHLGNEGNRAAHGVTVEIERTGPVFVWNAIGLPDGTCLKDDKDGDCLTVLTSGSITTANTLFWNIPLLAAGEELELSITSQSSSDKAARYGVAVTSASWEKETRRHDNSHHVWVSWDGGKTYLAEPSYSAEVRVDDRRPSAGDTVNFAVFAKNHNYSKEYGAIDDGCVNIRLTSGLTATGTPTLARQASDSFTNRIRQPPPPFPSPPAPPGRAETRAAPPGSSCCPRALRPSVHHDAAGYGRRQRHRKRAVPHRRDIRHAADRLGPYPLDDPSDNRVDVLPGVSTRARVRRRRGECTWTALRLQVRHGRPTRATPPPRCRSRCSPSVSEPDDGHGHGGGGGPYLLKRHRAHPRQGRAGPGVRHSQRQSL